MTADNDPMPTIRNLLKRLREEADTLGLDMGQAMIIPSPNGDGPDMLQAMFLIKPAAVSKDKQASEDERAVEEMFRRSQEAELDEKNATIKDEVQGWLDES